MSEQTDAPTETTTAADAPPQAEANTPPQVEANVSPQEPAEASAPAPAPKPGYPFSVLKVLGTALRVTKRNFVPFLVLACVLDLPVILLRLSGQIEDVVVALVLQLITHALMTAVVAYGVIMELHGSRPSTRACIAKGFAQIGPVVGVTVISTLAIGAATLLFVIPGIIVGLMFFVIVPVTVVEGLGIDAAMKRSSELTRGRKGDLFLIMTFAGALGVAIELVAQFELGPEAAFVWRAVGGAFSSMFLAVAVGVVYVELRKLRDGIQIPDIATAFARIRK
ncbi:MAG TPA: hypothetical protein VFV99_16755 [Kofleriaceae bacterium]|nr:hypothetical protein [Kofleriaceae bacterium]